MIYLDYHLSIMGEKVSINKNNKSEIQAENEVRSNIYEERVSENTIISAVENVMESNTDNNDNTDEEMKSALEGSKQLNEKKKYSNYNKNWETKYNWLYFDKTRGGAFCRYCEIYQKTTGGVFTTVPFINFRKATGKTGKVE